MNKSTVISSYFQTKYNKTQAKKAAVEAARNAEIEKQVISNNITNITISILVVSVIIALSGATLIAAVAGCAAVAQYIQSK